MSAAAPLEEKLAFLRAPAAHGNVGPVDVVETHLSWVFLCGDRALKLKKPLRLPWLDHTTLAAREQACREEVRLNRRLAPAVYRGVVPLCRGARGWRLGDVDGAPAADEALVDWLVLMRRLPESVLADHRIAAGLLAPAEVDALLVVLLAFYRRARRVDLSGPDYLARLQAEQVANREALSRPLRQGLGLLATAPLHDAYEAALQAHAGLLAMRAEQGRLVEGHGDLRPEHVALLDPPVVIDCLEFDVRLREVDPHDELAFLALECRVAGAPWVGPRLRDGYGHASADPAPPALWRLYTARRALLRARLAWLHLFEPVPRRPERWAPLTRRYLFEGRQALDGLIR